MGAPLALRLEDGFAYSLEFKDFEWHFNRAYEHMLEKYAEGGYMRLWLNSKRNVEGLTKLREIIEDKGLMREIWERLWRSV